ncbi:hypothetical protein NEHOM01_2242 [Nematocida homosporus]|uniref:uncharacterized protein n=1 Tax=Nematocida homosporus TaxID=1912981 RepID=UPI00221E9927|nr:uncharacterized protein NEHOM01_2242 [Nematocida homosporus]KAI5187523.1 hypothetical protein NEHOM01_2242 [Nematocida homosporus]
MTRSNEIEGNTVDLQPNTPVVIEHPCLECGEPGELRLLLVPDLFFPDSVLSSTNCLACGYKDTQVYQMDSASAGVKVICDFATKEDLRRYMIIAAGTEINIESEQQGVSFVQKEDGVWVVESLIRYVLEKIISQGTYPEDELQEEEMEGLGEYKDIAVFLLQSMDDINLTLTLKDNKGVSRVMPRGVIPEEGLKVLPFDYFIDDQVKMESFELPQEPVAVEETPDESFEAEKSSEEQ